MAFAQQSSSSLLGIAKIDRFRRRSISTFITGRFLPTPTSRRSVVTSIMNSESSGISSFDWNTLTTAAKIFSTVSSDTDRIHVDMGLSKTGVWKQKRIKSVGRKPSLHLFNKFSIRYFNVSTVARIGLAAKLVGRRSVSPRALKLISSAWYLVFLRLDRSSRITALLS